MLKKLLKNLIIFTLVVLTFFSATVPAFSVEEEKKEEIVVEDKLTARSPNVLLLDMKTGTVLFKRKPNEKVYPANLTTIMTAILTLENGNIEEVVTAKETALSNVKQGESKLGIIKDERLSVRQLLYAMMLTSSSDAANVLAEHIGGSIEKFTQKMNEKAKELGMKNTNFTNPIGNHDERHFTTANDMAKLCMYAFKNESLREIVKTPSYIIPATEKCDKERKIINKNYLVSTGIRNDYYYKYATGFKTGYTKEAKSCIAATAQKNGKELLCLVFKAETEEKEILSFSDCINLFEFVFNNYTARLIVKEGEIVSQTKLLNARRTEKVILQTQKRLDVLRHKEDGEIKVTFEDNVVDSVKAPVKKGEKLGERTYFVNGKEAGMVELVADKDYNFDPLKFLVNKVVWFFTSVWIFVVIIIALIVYVNIERRRRRKLREKRRENRQKRNMELEQKMMK